MNDVRIYPAHKPQETQYQSGKIAIVPAAEEMDGYAGFPQPVGKPTLLGEGADLMAKSLAVRSQEKLGKLLLGTTGAQALYDVQNHDASVVIPSSTLTTTV